MGHYPFNLILIIETQLKTFKNFYINITMEKLQSALVIRVPEPNNVQFKIFIGFKNIIISLKRTYARNSTVIIKGFLIGPF